MKQFVAGSIAAAVLSFVSAPVRAQTIYQISDAGMLAGCTTSAAMGLAATGEVVGSCGSDATFSTQHGWTSTNDTISAIGLLPGGYYSVAAAANSFGVVVGNGNTNFSARPQAIVVRDGQVINIDPVNGGNAYAIGITDGGAIFGDLTTSLSGSPSSWRAVMWTEDPSHPGRFRRTQLPMPTGGSTKTTGVFALGSSNAGHVIGWATSDVIGQQAALWGNDAAHTLTVLPGLGGMTIGQSVNSFGQAAGYSYGPDGVHAVAWSNDGAHTVTDLGVLPGDTSSQAFGINDLGQVVGISGSSATGETHAFLYSQGQMVALSSLLDASGAGWTIDQVVGINSSGEIAGAGLFNGQRRAFVMSPR